jgi:ferredoxin
VPCSASNKLYTVEEARVEAARCLHCECLECVKVCPYLEKFRGYPKKYAREIYKQRVHCHGNPAINRLINSCSLCGLCEAVCPEDFAMQTFAFSQTKHGRTRQDAALTLMSSPCWTWNSARASAFSCPGPNRGWASASFVLFSRMPVVGRQSGAGGRCLSSPAEQFGRRRRADAGLLRRSGALGGREGLFAGVLERFRQAGVNWAAPVIAACSTCRLMMKENLPEVDVASLWEILDETGLPEMRFRPSSAPAIHDPCTTRHAAGVQAAVRRLLERAGVDSWSCLWVGTGPNAVVSAG